MKKTIMISVGLIVLFAIVGAAISQQSKPAISSQDKKFIEEAAVGSQMEIKMGQLAAERASSPEVKNYGQRMVSDHTKANRELMSLAQQKGVSVKTDLDRGKQKKIDELAKKSGAEFDREYMKEITKEHKEDIKKFDKQAKQGQDPDIKSFASKTLPTLQEHGRMAEQIQPQVARK
jgi:putative membrane protein